MQKIRQQIECVYCELSYQGLWRSQTKPYLFFSSILETGMGKYNVPSVTYFLMDQNHRNWVSDCVQINEDYLTNLKKKWDDCNCQATNNDQLACPVCHT